MGQHFFPALNVVLLNIGIMCIKAIPWSSVDQYLNLYEHTDRYLVDALLTLYQQAVDRRPCQLTHVLIKNKSTLDQEVNGA